METLETRIRRIAQESIQEALAPHLGLLEELRRFAYGVQSQPVKEGAKPRSPRSRARTGNTVSCGIGGCPRPRVSKGYCLNHYVKRRNLLATGRLPPTWIENPGPGTVEDVKLPRGRAARKAPKQKK